MSEIKFPEGVFPNEIENYLNECSEKQGFSRDFLFSSCLSVLSVSIGSKFVIQYNNEWSETALLWIALVGESGHKKSPTLNAVFKPVNNYEKQKYKEYKNEQDIWESTKGESEKSPPIFKQLTVDDMTPEALFDCLAKNSHGLLCKKDELLTLIHDSNRYKGGGGLEEKLMSIYSNQDIVINRKSQGGLVVKITNPFLSLIGGIQPKIVGELFAGNRSDNGFINRLLFCYPEKYSPRIPSRSFDSKTYEGYENLIIRILKHSKGSREDVSCIKMNESAHLEFKKWQLYIYSLEDDGNIRNYKSKMEATALRIALIIEITWNMSRQKDVKEVNGISMQSAVKICKYFIENFKSINKYKGRSISDIKNDEIRNVFIKSFCTKPESKTIIKDLFEKGYRNSEISNALNMPKATVSKYSK